MHKPIIQCSRSRSLGNRLNAVRALLWLLVAFGALAKVAITSADVPNKMVIEAETIKSGAGTVYRDAKASGGKVTVLMLSDDLQELAKTSVTLPAGEYEMAAYFEAVPMPVLHSFKLTLKAGETSRTFSAIQVDPAPGYQRVAFRFRHLGGPLSASVSAAGITLTESVRKDNTEDEKSQGKTGVDFNSMPQITAKKGSKQTEQKAADDFEIEDSPDIGKLTFLDKRIAVDKIEITTIRATPAMVTMVDVDKIHYLPTETVNATARALGGPAGGKYQFVADLITETDTAQRVYSQDVTLEPNAASNFAFSFKLDGVTEFGHELRCSLLKDGKSVHESSAIFGVSTNVYRVGISGSAGPQNKRLMTPERAAKTMQYNKDSYANYFECFAWAPSELCKYVPDEELFWAGQLQYPGSISGFKNMFEAAHQRGVKGFSYGSVVAGGIEGFNGFQRHPLAFACNPASGTCSELLSTFFLERMVHKEYSFPSRKSAESIAWTSWSSIYGEESPEALDMLSDQISRMPDSLGWDGMRWDFAPGQLAELKKRVAAKHPNFFWGYNYAVANPGSPTFLPSTQGTFDGFNEMCKDHGLLMDESVRFWSNPSYRSGNIHDLYTALCHEANYVKRMGGLPLFMVLDGGGTHQDVTFGIFTGLSAGSRYCFYTSPGDFAYGSLAKFLTRFSAFVWDDTALIADAGAVVSVNVGKSKPNAPGTFPGPWWDQSTWLRKLPDGRQQLLVNIINPPGYLAYSNRVQTPSATLYDLSVGVPTPAGAKLLRTFQVSPELPEGLVQLSSATEGQTTKVVVPSLKSWTIVVFEYGSAASGPLAYPAFRLTTPVEDAVAYAKGLADEKLKEIQRKAQNLKMGHDDDASDTQPAESQPAPVLVNKRPVQHWNDFKHEYNIDADVLQTLKLPEDRNIRRDGVLDVHHVKGVFNWLNPIELSIGLAGGGTCTSSYISRESFRSAARGYLDDFPATFADLLHYDVVILDNMHTLDLGPARRAMLNEYVKDGGSVLIFGGYYNLSRGADRNTAIGELDPVNIVENYNLFEDNKGMPLKPAAKGFFPEGIDWSANPCAYSVDKSPLKPGVEVLATVGDHPAIVRSTFGKGRVITFLMNVHGDYPDSSLPYWKWSGYAKVIAACLKWLGEDASKVYIPPVVAAKLDPKEVNPENLVIEASMLESKEFTKRLESATRNMVDKTTASAVLDCAVQFADKVDDQDIMGVIAEKAGLYVDASFAPLAKKLVRSQHPKLRRVGYQVLGLAGDKSFHPFVELGLDDTDIENQRTALIALGRLNEPAAIPRIKSYLFRGREKLLAYGVMHKLGDRASARDALPIYTTTLLDYIDHRCTRLATEYALWGPGGPRLTPSKRKNLMLELHDLYDAEFCTNFDSHYFVDSFNNINDDELTMVTEFLSKADSYRVSQLAYGLIPKLNPDQMAKYKAGLVNATQPELQVLAKQ